jgi:hypothetical protein
MIGFFLFGILYAEILNNLDLISYKFNPYIFGTVISLVFLISEIVLKHFQNRASLSNQNQLKFDRIRNIYYICMSIIGFILLVMVPLVWWGAIKKLAESANKGIY